MKTIFIMRHAKSSWDHPGLDDHERPLNARGERDAPRMARLIVQENLTPDVIVCSSAVRANTTAEIVAAECGSPLEVDGRLYASDQSDYIVCVQERKKKEESVLLVGHNPTAEDVIAALTGAKETMPTAALAQIEYPVERWKDVKGNGAGTLVNVWRPRELND